MTCQLQLNPQARFSLEKVGKERIPILIMDDLFLSPQPLLSYAKKYQEHFLSATDYYPGRKLTVDRTIFGDVLGKLTPILKHKLELDDDLKAEHAELAVTTTLPEKLKPIQMLPHFDSIGGKTFAFVYYCVDNSFGGTRFYRHLGTEFESMTSKRLPYYAPVIKQQAMTAKLHLSPQYNHQDNALFEVTSEVPFQQNRAIMYPSNCFHSGVISKLVAWQNDPLACRLTFNLLFKAVTSENASLK
ncbi:DUF6445 family protein [Thalassotalea euphylliae]|uniref:DUF6445 family protein n=1 Tax=Thalassotalea euphylliae TaxID=1655234 RepID=UPI00362DA0A5